MKHQLTQNKRIANRQIQELVNAFEKEKTLFEKKSYKEAQLRIDFINPLLKSLGWDVANEKGASQLMRTVIQEESIDVEEGGKLRKKNPDYTLKTLGKRAFFIETKKVSIDITDSQESAFQVRRYGWNANLGMSVLTNFKHLIIYDCRYCPILDDAPHVARYKIYSYEEYVEKFEEIYELLSLSAVQGGAIDNLFSFKKNEGTPFDEYFLDQINGWRVAFANDIISNNEGILESEINLLIQRLINRIIFLRICEDREIEIYETLKTVKDYDALKALFQESDKKYNSGLFDFIEDKLSLTLKVSPELLISVFESLYYPLSPYDFSVVDSTILSQIYERFLGNRLKIEANNSVLLEEEPEVVASDGVVPTPKLIVDRIVLETIDPIIEGKGAEEMLDLKIGDICCGSGSFLIGLFDALIERYTQKYIEEGSFNSGVIYEVGEGTYQLSLKAKKDILVTNIFGVDLNPYAAEVTRFSLLLKLLEGENSATVDHYLQSYGKGVLPNLNENIKCGNSLVGSKIFEFDTAVLTDEQLQAKIRPFDFEDEFSFFEENEGFDAIIGNPPYVRIQNLVKYNRSEVAFYRNKKYGYEVTSKENFDKYYLFIERALMLLNSNGVLGYIVPHKFFVLKSGKRLRKHITENSNFQKIIHFGVTQVFQDRLTYTAILVLTKKEKELFDFERVSEATPSQFIKPDVDISYNCSNYGIPPWVFLSKAALTVINKMHSKGFLPLGEAADVTVGVQTSADPIYIITDYKETDGVIEFKKEGNKWKIETDITKSCFYDLSFSLFDTPTANGKIIFPYSMEDDRARPYNETEMENSYPECFAYLQHYRERLEKRSIQGGRKEEQVWYQYGRSQSLTKFHDTEKLIWSVLSVDAPYAYEPNNVLFTGGGNGPYYALIPKEPYSIFYILGILSFPPVESIVKAGASEFQGAYYSHGKQFIINLPIPIIDFEDPKSLAIYEEVIDLVQQLLSVQTKIKNTKIGGGKVHLKALKFLKNRLDAVIRGLYGITLREQLIMTRNLFVADQDTNE